MIYCHYAALVAFRGYWRFVVGVFLYYQRGLSVARSNYVGNARASVVERAIEYSSTLFPFYNVKKILTFAESGEL